MFGYISLKNLYLVQLGRHYVKDLYLNYFKFDGLYAFVKKNSDNKYIDVFINTQYVYYNYTLAEGELCCYNSVNFIELLEYIDDEDKKRKILMRGYIHKKDLYIILEKLNAQEDTKTMRLKNNVIEFKNNK